MGSDFPLSAFAHCPRCGSTDSGAETIKLFACRACGFRYFQNAAGAVIAVIRDSKGRVLLTRRAKEPERGKLGLPGGFVDPLETAEEALVREVREEVGLEITIERYLGSYTNRYPYGGVTYYSLDLVFLCRPIDPEQLAARDEVAEAFFLYPAEVNPADIAFASAREAVALVQTIGAETENGEPHHSPSP